MKDSSPLHHQSFTFAVQIVDYHRSLVRLKEYIIGKQILKSGTSIGANIYESIHAQSKDDYISKLSISLKEAQETDFWLRLCIASKILSLEAIQLREKLKGILKMLVSTLNTLKSSEKNL